MNSRLKPLYNALLVLLLTLAMLLSVFFSSYYLLKLWQFAGVWMVGEVFILKAQLAVSKSFWPSLYQLRIVLYALIFFIGLLTIAGHALILLRKAFAPLPRKYLYVMFTGGIVYILLLLILWGASLAYGTFTGPGNTILFYGAAPPLEVQQQHVADSRGMNYFVANTPLYCASRKVNEQGFIAPFNYTAHFCDSVRKAGKKIVFIIGDSFVEGVSEGSYDSVFTEHIRRMDTSMALLTFGVGGTDPLNYKLIAEKYVPLLKPDLVLIAFCWNDVMMSERIATPYIPLYYQTSMGFLCSNVPYRLSGKHNVILPSADSAFNYYKGWYFIDTTESKLAWLCSKNPLTAKAYTYYNRLPDYIDTSSANAIVTVSYRHIKAIDSVCIANGTKMSIAFIPDIAKADIMQTLAQNHSEYKHVFHEYLPRVHFIEKSITRADYISKQNQHFNSIGNRKYAAFLQQVIHAELSKP